MSYINKKSEKYLKNFIFNQNFDFSDDNSNSFLSTKSK